ncbi:Epidermal growth factor receptor kinase substrate 8-like protein 1 [Nibea albiflora]|uniref:Epidermal growth factor receptor kinase substrate 8-like protein 1 n=1 Tax=Nibea albiflora TaxID=240163 RepID=A0ACB7EYR9_NIBAL|nr:Epidermal growth factor receptor kinase substrate 8-like protein 1 [Nibea albiflora]
MITPGEQLPPGGLPIYTGSSKENGTSGKTNHTSLVDAEREVEILNHCFDDVERFMARLQQTAEAQSVLNQRKKKKRSTKSKKKDDQNDDLLTLKACPPSEEEFVDILQKIKYCLSLLIVKTTGGPALAASVGSPAMTSGAVLLLSEHLTEEEKGLWTSLGANWTLPCSQLSVPVPPYSPVFLDGWQPQAYDSNGQATEDPIESQHKQDAFRESRAAQTLQDQARQTAGGHGEGTDEVEGNSLPPEGERLYCCSYDFVARNSSELSVLQGETLEVIESSKRWWKCRNRFDQIGFVPHNILEPLSALNNTGRDSPVVRRESKKTALSPRAKYFSYAPPSPDATSPIATSPLRPQSMVLPSTTMQGEDSDRVLIMNDELLQRLAEKRGSVRPLVSLGILTGAQLFSLNKEELRTVSPDEGARVYSQIMVQKALLEDVHKATELEKAMERQKLRIDEELEQDLV